jgi:hypothetical protein
MLLGYLARISETDGRGDAREESFYGDLAALIERLAAHRGQKVRVTTIPRLTDGCLVDFQVWRGRRVVGYVEAKRPGTDLDAAERSEQVRRYRAAFPNLILTDFHEFRLLRGDPGDPGNAEAARARLVRPLVLRLGVAPILEGERELEALFELFLDFAAPPAASAASLAIALAGRTRVLDAHIEELLRQDTEGATGLSGLFKAFSEYLITGLTRRDFSDLYAQTIAYGLLAARRRAPGENFDRRIAADQIPRSSGLLRDVFRFLLLDPPPGVGWIIDDLTALLADTDPRRVLARGRRQQDPILHFYETFLKHYDRALRVRRGVFYTPRELVSWMVRSVHELLKTRLGRPGGLADPSVTVLDPAAGTLTFLVEAIDWAVQVARENGGDGVAAALLRDHLLRDFHGFELMMAPYAIGHLKVALMLEEEGWPLGEDERFPLYLTNALEMEKIEQMDLPFVDLLARESREAYRVKKEQAFTVILGNPPWAGHSANRGKPVEEIEERLRESYYQVDGRPLGERNPKWLQDDYVKFLRFAQMKVDEAGEGIVAFVTNHGWLDNPTFRGMRRSLLDTFDEVHVLDLHGNAKKRERGPGGAADENVFEGVMQGAAVALLVKKPGLSKKVLRADLRGSRREKLDWLHKHDVASTEWTPGAPAAPAFLFTPRDAVLEEEYGRGVPLPEVFPVHSAGVVTGRDAFVIDRDLRELRRRIEFFRSPYRKADEFRLGEPALLDTGSWRLDEARPRAWADAEWGGRFLEILYRPFDRRWIFFADYLIERPRHRVMDLMLDGGNVGLVVPRQSKGDFGALVTGSITAHKAVSAYDINSVFPLWFWTLGERVANISPELEGRLARDYGEEVHPREILHYVYAVLYGPAYRERYADLLRADFPRVPFPRERGRFLEMAGLGAVLVDLHLPKRDRPARTIRFEGPGSGRIGKPRRTARDYRPAERRVVVNEEGQSFTGISPEVWAYRIGGYPVLDHWLADRKEKTLSFREIEEFRWAAEAIGITIEVQRSIDAAWR